MILKRGFDSSKTLLEKSHYKTAQWGNEYFNKTSAIMFCQNCYLIQEFPWMEENGTYYNTVECFYHQYAERCN